MGALADSFDSIIVAPNAADATATPSAVPRRLSQEFDEIKIPEVVTQKPVVEVPRKTDVIESLGAGAGSSFGKGVLGLQQIVGKLTSWASDALNSETGKKAGEWLQKDAVAGARNLDAQNARYEAGNPTANIVGQVTGLVTNPANKLIPIGGTPATLVGAATKGALQGAALNTLTSPVTDESKDFLTEKMRQGAIGAIGGAAGGSLAYGIAQGMKKGIDYLVTSGNRLMAGDATKAADTLTSKTLADVGLNPLEVKNNRPEMFNFLAQKAKDAIATGKPVDPQEYARLIQAQTLPVPVPMLKGQLSRDPMQFAMEQNLRGITGVGEPITQTLTNQNRALIENLNVMGAKDGGTLHSAGEKLVGSLDKFGKDTQKAVAQTYKAFRDSTGREMDVPTIGLAQDYSKILGDFGDAIPSAVRNKFESLGLLTGKQNKIFSIENAESLIKNINDHYDPMNRAQATALGKLRQSVQNAIIEGSGESAIGTEAAGLAMAARRAAAKRFALIDATPGLDAAMKGEQPDKFVEKFVLGGNLAEVKNMIGVLSKTDPQAVKTLQGSVMNYIKEKSLNGHTEGNGTFSADQLKRFVGDQHMAARLEQVLGKQKMDQLKQLYNVAENAIYAPTASAVNRSNTAGAAANVVKSEMQGGSLNALLDIAKRVVPVVSTPASEAQRAIQANRAATMVDQSINPSLAQSGSARLSDIVGSQLNQSLRPDVNAARAAAAFGAEETKRQNRK